MRDVSNKYDTLRTARAEGRLTLSPQTLERIRQGDIPKGNPLEVSKVAAIQAAKNTPQFIPYCHPVPVDFVGVAFELGPDSIVVNTEVKAVYRTGVEMEALVAASAALLNLYDMLKMLDENMEIVGVRLLSKTGGKSDYCEPLKSSPRTAVLVMSDSIAAQQSRDESGRLIVEHLRQQGCTVQSYEVIPDEPDTIEHKLKHFADQDELDLVLTTGGTGLGPRDHTTEVVERLIERRIPGISEAIRSYGIRRNPYAMLSCGIAGQRRRTLIVTLPGSTGGVRDGLTALFPAVLHALSIIRGGQHEAR